jgi:plasmid stabilization system protein ParE
VKIHWTAEAEKWLQEIFHYISKHNRQTAKRVVSEIFQKVDILEDCPELGQRLLYWPNLNIRMILYGNYRIVYWLKDKGRVDILGIYHGALDLEKHIKLK